MTHSASSSPHEAPARLPAAEVASALDDILFRLFQLFWTRIRYSALLGPLLRPLWIRLSRTRGRLARALAHLAAGTSPRPSRPRPSRPRPTARGAGKDAPFPHRHFGWLGAITDYHVRGYALQIQHLLEQPGVAETIAASPGAARTLRPLCHMLGVELPAPLRLPPAPPRPAPPPVASPSASTPAPASPNPPPPVPQDRPIEPYILAAARYWKRRGLENA